MEQIIIRGAETFKALESQVNQELRTLDGTLVDIKYTTIATPTGFYFSAMIIYRKEL
ncbi:sporulation protein Cse60 [Bacillota bacterium Lsc_1132]